METSTSQAGITPWPSIFGRSLWETAAFRTPASWSRICRCWCGGYWDTMRMMVSFASRVCSVESTRWPVSAAVSAMSMVSLSRISPTRITSGSCLRAALRAEAKELVSEPTSRWLIMDFRSLCRNSMGSSMVITWQLRLVLMWFTMAASVVDLPEPVVPVTRMSPLRSRAIFFRTSGRFRSSSDGGSVGTTLNTMP